MKVFPSNILLHTAFSIKDSDNKATFVMSNKYGATTTRYICDQKYIHYSYTGR